MSLNNRHATILLLLISTILLIIIDIIVVLKFFTYDELIENTYINASINTTNSIIEEKESILENSLNITNTDAIKNTNETEITNNSRNDEDVYYTTSRSIDIRTFDEENYIINEDIYEEKYIEPIEEEDIEEDYIDKEPIEDKTVFYNSSIGTITIPKTNVDLQIFDTITNSNMNTGTCFLYSTGSLNNCGTTIIVGHNYQNGRLFSNNDNLQIGDVIYITLLDGNSYCYTVYDKIYTTPEDLSYLDRNTSNQPEIALSSCTDNEEGRIVILAR